MRSSLRISIPYGFDTPLPILNGGSEVIASGHGGCTDGQQVTVAITITQAASSAVATGEKVQNCNGMLQTWSAVTTATTSDLFVNGAAEACGFATTRDGTYITDTFNWCKDVNLVELNEQTYLPIAIKQ